MFPVGTASVGSNPISVYVQGEYAYTANEGSGDMSIVDVSNPTSPVTVSTIPVGSGAYSVYVSERYGMSRISPTAAFRS